MLIYWCLLVFSWSWQTGFIEETEAAKVERVKQEKGIFWEPSAEVAAGEVSGTLVFATDMGCLTVWIKLQQGELWPLLTDKTKLYLSFFLSFETGYSSGWP